MLVFAREDAETLARKVTLFKGEHVETRWAREVVEERSYNLSDASADGAQRCWFLRWSTESSTRSFPSCGLGVLSCVLSLLDHHR
jgi:hypothetical protein